MYNEIFLKIFIGNQFFAKKKKTKKKKKQKKKKKKKKKTQFYTSCPTKIALSSTILNLLQSQRFDIGINQK